jgi:hypothetical protein
MTKVYEINVTLTIQDFVEADSAEEAEQAYFESFNSSDELLEMATVTVTETDKEVWGE